MSWAGRLGLLLPATPWARGNTAQRPSPLRVTPLRTPPLPRCKPHAIFPSSGHGVLSTTTMYIYYPSCVVASVTALMSPGHCAAGLERSSPPVHPTCAWLEPCWLGPRIGRSRAILSITYLPLLSLIQSALHALSKLNTSLSLSCLQLPLPVADTLRAKRPRPQCCRGPDSHADRCPLSKSVGH